MKILVNNVEQHQPQRSSGTEIILYGRNAAAPDDRYEITVTGFDPYFYALDSAVEADESYLLSQDTIASIEYGASESLEDGKSLARIETPYPQDVPQAKEHFDQTWAADVQFTNRFRVDTGLRAYAELPDEAVDGCEAEIHWRELEPLVPPSSAGNPKGEGGESGGE